MREKTKESASLRFLYRTVPGRMILRPLSSRAVSRVCGKFLDSPCSRPLVGRFVRKNEIDLSLFEEREYRCFNDCFTRRIRKELRPFDPDEAVLSSPCDGLLSIYRIREDTVIPVKQSRYSIPDLLGNDPLAENYRDGICAVFRLCVDHYHRYAYAADGAPMRTKFLPGVLHTVRPIALEQIPVFVRNCREYTVFDSDRFGLLTQIEVGALLVGKIRNHPLPERVRKGDEKGMFLYGGSTVILLIEKDRAVFPEEWFEATGRGEEIPVKMGQTLAKQTENA